MRHGLGSQCREKHFEAFRLAGGRSQLSQLFHVLTSVKQRCQGTQCLRLKTCFKGTEENLHCGISFALGGTLVHCPRKCFFNRGFYRLFNLALKKK